MTDTILYTLPPAPARGYQREKGTMTVAYSYRRYSAKKQGDGDSIRRQNALRDAWLARHDVILDTSMKIDRGKSAFKGVHIDHGALGEFIRQVEAGDIPRGSYLIVESLDRLSRQEAKKALRLILDLIERGIRIVQLAPREMVYDDDSSEIDLILMIVELSRGHSESKMKHIRGSEKCAERRKVMREGKATGFRHPAWLRRSGEGWEPIPERWETVQRVFALAAEGHGLVSMMRILRAEGRPSFGRSGRWNTAYLHAILTDGRAMGRATPCVAGSPEGEQIEGYYPTAVSTAVEQAALATLARNTRYKGGRTNRQVNIFAGMLRSARSGLPFHLCTRTTPEERRAGKPPRSVLLAGDTAEESGLIESMSYPVIERSVLSALAELDVSTILGNRAAVDEKDSLTRTLGSLDADLQALAAALEGPVSPLLVRAVQVKEDERRKVIDRIKELARETPDVTGAAWETFRNLVMNLDAAEDAHGIRLRIRTALRDMVRGMWALIVRRGKWTLTAIQIRFVGDTAVREYLVIHRQVIGRVGHASKPAVERVLSLRSAVAGEGIDLRRAEDVDALEAQLLALDLQ